MNESQIIAATKLGATTTYGGSAVTAGSAYAAEHIEHSFFMDYLTEIGVIVGIVTAICGLALQAYFGWQKLKLQRVAYEKLGVKAIEVDSSKVDLHEQD
ncbi:MAG: hypothetical protein ACRCVX_08485 [Shewanella sp.]